MFQKTMLNPALFKPYLALIEEQLEVQLINNPLQYAVMGLIRALTTLLLDQHQYKEPLSQCVFYIFHFIHLFPNHPSIKNLTLEEPESNQTLSDSTLEDCLQSLTNLTSMFFVHHPDMEILISQLACHSQQIFDFINCNDSNICELIVFYMRKQNKQANHAIV